MSVKEVERKEVEGKTRTGAQKERGLKQALETGRTGAVQSVEF